MFSRNLSLFVLLPAIAIASFGLTWTSSYQDFSVYDLIFIGIFCTVALLLETLVLLLLNHIPGKALRNWIFACFALFNAYVLHFSFIQAIGLLELAYQLALAAAGLFIFHTLKEIADKSRTGLFAICGTMLVLVIVNAVAIPKADHSDTFASLTDHQTTELKPESDPGHPDSQPVQAAIHTEADHLPGQDEQRITDHMKFVKFTERPNIYIVAFDALMPETLLSLYLDLENVPYSTYLKQNFRTFQNMFADVVPTRGSLNAMLAFDMTYFEDLQIERRSELFSGQVMSPLTTLFKRNGYTINTLYASHYFGNSKGPYIDNYFIGVPFTVCQFIDGKTRSIAFFGFCALEETYFWQTEITYWEPVKHLLAALEQQRQENTPQFFLAYLFSPGHTKIDFNSRSQADVDEYRQRHLDKSSDTAEMIRQLKAFVDRSGGRDILFVLGDHGPFLSRSLKLADDPGFYVRDRWGIYGGIYPRDRCADYLKEDDNLDFNTPTIVLQKLVLCLSGGQDPFIIPQHIVGPLGAPDNLNYERLEYE